jgi:hypothetical protein
MRSRLPTAAVTIPRRPVTCDDTGSTGLTSIALGFSRHRALMVDEGAFASARCPQRDKRARNPSFLLKNSKGSFGMATVFELGMEPGAGVSPVAVNGCKRDLHHPGDLGHGSSRLERFTDSTSVTSDTGSGSRPRDSERFLWEPPPGRGQDGERGG